MIASNSAGVIAPLSSISLALSISVAAPPFRNLPDVVGELPLRRLDLNPITPGHPRALHDQIDEHAEIGNTIRKIIQKTFAPARGRAGPKISAKHRISS
jgi:hypothetical protein